VNFLNQTIDLATAGKALALAAGLGGGVLVLKSDIAHLGDTKADRVEVAPIPAKLDGIDRRLERIESTLDRIDDKLDGKVDKP
jgi:hypothetical protein